MKRSFRSIAVLVATVAGCGSPDQGTDDQGAGGVDQSAGARDLSQSGDAGSSGSDLAGGDLAQGPAIQTVFLILMENHNWSDIAGSASAPYINQTLLPMASHAESYFNPPNIHPSEPNYLWLEAGTNFGVLNDNDPSKNHQASTMHLATLLKNAKVSWKSYQEDITADTCPLTAVKSYAPKHNPFVFFDDSTGTLNTKDPYCVAHNRPMTELAADLTNNTVARYNFLTPNLCDDMHDTCAPTNNSVKQGDDWLKAMVPVITASAAYQNGGAIFITWDESEGGDLPIGMIVLSKAAKGNNYAGMTRYTHSSTLRTMEEIFGVAPFLGDAANATDLADLFTNFP
jgi:hypothetical protein